MITVRVDFFNKKTEKYVGDIKIDVPDNLVYTAVAQDEYTGDEFLVASESGQQIDYINCRPFGITEEIKAYAIGQNPDLEEKFDEYLCEFIGRHGLGPEYD